MGVGNAHDLFCTNNAHDLSIFDFFPVFSGGLFVFVFAGDVIASGFGEVKGEILLRDVVIGIIVGIFVIFEKRAEEVFGNLNSFACVDISHGGLDSDFGGI